MIHVLATSRRRLATIVAFASTIALCALPQTSSAQEYHGVAGVRIRATSAGVEVGDIASAVQLTSGIIIIADNANRQLHFYSALGRFIRSVGRNGDGPGEFRAVKWVGECGRDTVYAYDYMANRVSTFTAAGVLVKTSTPPVGEVAVMRCTVDGNMLYVASASNRGMSSFGAIQTADAAGKFLYRGPEVLLRENRPLAPSISIAIGPDGIVYGTGDSTFVRSMSIRGEGVRKLPFGQLGRAPTEANRTASINYWATQIRDTQEGYEKMRQMLRKLPPVKTLPAYNDLFVDITTKSIYLKTSNLGDPATVLDRLGPDGVTQGRVTLPPDLEVQQIRTDVLLAKQTDPATGEQLLVRYRLSK